MTIEVATYLNQLDSLYPVTGDQVAEGDDHIRQLKAVLKATFPGLAGPAFRTISKAATFTPAVTEISAIFVASASYSVTLPAVGGIPDGAFYAIQARAGAVTLVPNGAELINAAASLVVPASSWAIFAKFGAGWVGLLSLGGVIIASNLSLAGTNGQVLTHNGTTWVSAAPAAGAAAPNWSNLSGRPAGLAGWSQALQGNQAFYWGSNDLVTSYPVPIASMSVGYATSAGTAANVAGYVPGQFSLVGHEHPSSYAPMTAVVSAYSVGGLITFTRANGTTFNVDTSGF